MKKLITFLFAVLITAINANASAVLSDDGKTLTLNNFVEADAVVSNVDQFTDTQLAGVKTLIIVGSIGNTNTFKDKIASKVTGLEVLDMSGMNADEVASNKDGIGAMSSITTIKFPNALEVIPAELCEGFSNLTSVSLPTSLKTIDSSAFKACSSLQEITLPYGLETIGGHAFDNSGLVSISIPGTVELIEADAFSVCNDLSKVVFEEVHEGDPAVNMTIRGNAFQNANSVWDVYVLTTGTIHCEPLAFSQAVTYGQGETTHRLSVLHYPEEKAEDYVNQNHLLTSEIAHDSKLYQAWLVEHASKAGEARNGWFEFVEAGPSPRKGDPGIEEKFLKTWSESGTKKTVYVKYEQVTIQNDNEIKKYNKVVASSDTPMDGYVEEDYYMARLVPDGVRAYIVKGISTNDGVKYTLTLNRVQVIPPNTGVILYGQANATTSDGTTPALLMKQVPYVGYPLSRDSKADRDARNKEYDSDLINYLVGTGDGTVTVDPYEDDPNTNEVAFRNFFMNRFTETDTYKNYRNNPDAGWTKDDDYIGFFRAKHNDSFGPRKAYLHLDADQFPESKGYECIVAKDVDYDREYNANGKLAAAKSTPIPFSNPVAYYWANRYWEGLALGATNGTVIGYDWGNRPTNKNIDDYLVSYRGEFEREVDGIVTLTIPAEVKDNEFYTLQGVKVTNPTKSGIYIKNGKKIVIK